MKSFLGCHKKFIILKRKTIIIERPRMVGDYELVHEPDVKMFRIMNMKTEEFSAWFSPSEAEKLKKMDDDGFFATAEKSIQDARDSSDEQTGDTKTEI